MNLRPPKRSPFGANRGVMLLECLMYFALVTLVQSIATMAIWKCWDANTALRGNAEDIVRALHAGEQWRADVRAASGPIRQENRENALRVRVPAAKGAIVYTLAGGKLTRRSPGAREVLLLPKVKSSSMTPDQRHYITAWRWDLELERIRRSPGMRPLFTFEAVPGYQPSQ